MRQKTKGFVLVELIIFIVIAAIAIVTIVLPLTTVLNKATIPTKTIIANELARGRMEIIFGQFQKLGYTAFSDPCLLASPPAVCTLPSALSGYTINSSISTVTVLGLSGIKQITVTVTGPSGVVQTSLVSLVGQY